MNPTLDLVAPHNLSIDLQLASIEGGTFDPLSEAPAAFEFQYVFSGGQAGAAEARVFGKVTITRADVEADTGKAYATIPFQALARSLKKLLRQAIRNQITASFRKDPVP